MNNDTFSTPTAGPGLPVVSFLLGAILGASIALLVAPAPGEETRRKLSDAARRLGNNVNDGVQTARDQIKHRADDVRSAVNAGRDAYARSRAAAEPEPTSSAM